MIPWTLIIGLAQSVGPDVVAEVKRLYTSWKANGAVPTQAEWDAVLLKVTETNLRKILEAEIAKQAVAG